MTAPRTQAEQVLAMLRKAGAHGVHTFELRREFIGNPSQRIAELRDRGHGIRVSERERLHGRSLGVRYFLEYDAEHGALFDPDRYRLDAA